MSADRRSAWRCAALWALLAAGLNLVWEIVQLPLYTIYQTGSASSIAFAVGHCTVGDVIIALSCYGVAVFVTRRPCWIVERPLSGAATVVLLGLGYTAFSEWLNVSVRASWQYAAAMPTIGGIGIAPLLQWLLIPVLTVFWARKLA